MFPDGLDSATMLGERGVFVGPVDEGRKAKPNNEDDERLEISKCRIELEAEELFTDGKVEVASDAEGDVDVQMGAPPASEGMANGVEEAEVLEELGMYVDVADVEERPVPAKAGMTPVKRASPTKPASKSQPTPTTKPERAPKSKPMLRATRLAEEVIELESSSSEGGAGISEWVKANGKGKTQAKVIEEVEEEEEEPPAEKSRPKPKPTTKFTKPKAGSESDDAEEQDGRPSKTPKSKARASGPPFKRLSILSVESGDQFVVGPHEDEEEKPIERPSKKLKRCFSAPSVPDDDDEGEDEVEEKVIPTTKFESKSTTKPAKSTKRQPNPPSASSSEGGEEPIVAISKPKTKPAKSSLLNTKCIDQTHPQMY